MEESQPARWFSISAVLRRIGFGGGNNSNENQSLHKSRGGEDNSGEYKGEDQQAHNKNTNASNEKSVGPQEVARVHQVPPKKQVRGTQLSLRGNKRGGSQGIWKHTPNDQIQSLPDRIAQLVEEEKRKKRAKETKTVNDQTEKKGLAQTEKKNGQSERTVQIDQAEVERVFGRPESPPTPIKKRISDKRIGDHRVRVSDRMLRVYPSSSEDEMVVEVIDESKEKDGTIDCPKGNEHSEKCAQSKSSELSDNCEQKAANRISIASIIAPPEEEGTEKTETVETAGTTQKTEKTETSETIEIMEKAEATIEITEKTTETAESVETTGVATSSGTEKATSSDFPTFGPARPATSSTKRNKKRKDGNKRKRARTSRGSNKFKTSLDNSEATDPLTYTGQTENDRVDPRDFDISQTSTVPSVNSSPHRARDKT